MPSNGPTINEVNNMTDSEVSDAQKFGNYLPSLEDRIDAALVHASHQDACHLKWMVQTDDAQYSDVKAFLEQVEGKIRAAANRADVAARVNTALASTAPGVPELKALVDEDAAYPAIVRALEKVERQLQPPVPVTPVPKHNDRTADVGCTLQETIEQALGGDLLVRATEYVRSLDVITGSGKLTNKARALCEDLLAKEELFEFVYTTIRSGVAALSETDPARKAGADLLRANLRNWKPGNTSACKKSNDRWLLECLASTGVMEDGTVDPALAFVCENRDMPYNRNKISSNDLVQIEQHHMQLSSAMYHLASMTTVSLHEACTNMYRYLKRLVDWEEVGHDLVFESFYDAVQTLAKKNRRSKPTLPRMSKEKVAMLSEAYNLYAVSPGMFVEILVTGGMELQPIVQAHAAIAARVRDIQSAQEFRALKARIKELEATAYKIRELSKETRV
jgi:hypothetical protein